MSVSVCVRVCVCVCVCARVGGGGGGGGGIEDKGRTLHTNSSWCNVFYVVVLTRKTGNLSSTSIYYRIRVRYKSHQDHATVRSFTHVSNVISVCA